MKTGKGMGIFLVGGTRVASLALVIAAASAASGGYGDLPDTFDASTGYVTLNASDGYLAGNQSFFFAKNWSDGNAPHPGAGYYVPAGRWLGTPHVDSDVTAQLDVDPDCQTFKGRTLVIAGYIWHLNGTYEFTFPDLHMLPGAYISYTALKPSLNGKMTVYGTSENPVRVKFAMSVGYSILMGMKMNGDSGSCLATDWGTQTPSWLKLTGDLSDYSACKAAVIGLTHTLAMENAKRGITVNCVSPGWISRKEEGGVQPCEGTWVGWSGDASDVARAVVFLASDSAWCMTGVDMPVDGGRILGPHNCDM